MFQNKGWLMNFRFMSLKPHDIQYSLDPYYQTLEPVSVEKIDGWHLPNRDGKNFWLYLVCYQTHPVKVPHFGRSFPILFYFIYIVKLLSFMFTLKKIRTSPYALLVTISNGYKVKVIEIGNVTIAPNITLHKVLFVPIIYIFFLFISDSILNALSHLLTLNVNCIPL